MAKATGAGRTEPRNQSSDVIHVPELAAARTPHFPSITPGIFSRTNVAA